MTLSLEGRVAVVTGAAKGFGRAAAVALATEGCDIVGIDAAAPVSSIPDYRPASPEDLSQTGRSVQALGRRWLAYQLDQRNMPALRDLAHQIKTELKRIDIVFANAGIQPGTKFGASYSASKWGILGLMKSIALELVEHKITVNAVIPGLINTTLTRHEDRYAQALGEGGKSASVDPEKDESAAIKVLKGKTPLGLPWIEPEDVASAVVFLASYAARMITGTTIAVTGGDSAHGVA
ncbi:NAD(P)-dependent dehydrogenase (short-subunit alcohol dehydrogenase family) [Rhodanobacter sp. K2T2]|uniref:SDR family NAD(P)-dependent oxidoreductase n=1 Tax=Rhodanobacter sp. K2T2 TaxID=2723085 RepID=UPI0015C82422|nr:SDR family oxidoreductase [Rhodanobacter sp. K2T2]NYE27154.1 NAD(P)-dependent dehydrogenase (short-subunit alcohol dehydrogenase family) [Rhodanobacter sp. K2T2]